MAGTSPILDPDDFKLRGPDLVLLLLAADTEVDSARDRINGVTRLEKLLYLVERTTKISSAIAYAPLEFKAYNYGPFSRDVYQAVEMLESNDLVTEERRIDGRTIDNLEDLDMIAAVEEDEEFVERCYVLTGRGKAVASLLGEHHPEVVRELSQLKDEFAGRSLSSLIRYVYNKYPESTVNSKIRHLYL